MERTSTTTANERHELDDYDQHRSTPNEVNNGTSPQAADGGKDAWLFLAACFICEALIWGFAFSFGVFQAYYSTHEPFSSDTGSIATIGTSSTGVMYMIGLLLFPAYQRWPRLANISKWAGLPVITGALILASFATNVTQMILTQGVLYAVGGSLLYCPTLIFLDEWFIKRKGLAFGVMWAGSGVGGLVIPFLVNFLLTNYGFRSALRIYSIINVIISAPFVYFIRPRLPIRRGSQVPAYGPGLRFLKTSTFWVLEVGLILESLGYFIPSIYLPTYATYLGLSSSIGSLLVALINALSVIGTVIMGMLIDRFHVTTVILLSTIGAAISIYLFWGFSTALPLLCIFSVAYCFFAGGFVSTNAGVIKLVKAVDEKADVGMLLGFLSAGRGIGALVSGPLSEALLHGNPWKGELGFAYGSGYGLLIVFTGITAVLGGVSVLGRRLGWVY